MDRRGARSMGTPPAVAARSSSLSAFLLRSTARPSPAPPPTRGDHAVGDSLPLRSAQRSVPVTSILRSSRTISNVMSSSGR